jgi:hypothetical protein
MRLAGGQFHLVNNRSGWVVARLTHGNLNWSGSIWQMIAPGMSLCDRSISVPQESVLELRRRDSSQGILHAGEASIGRRSQGGCKYALAEACPFLTENASDASSAAAPILELCTLIKRRHFYG